MKQKISENLVQLRGRIAEACEEYDRDADDITIVAVTKAHSAGAISHAVAAGIHHVGESRLQDALPKIAEVGPIARFHMIGHLQSNKAKKAVEAFDVIQSVDTIKLAEEINRHAAELDRVIECLLEVNCSGEEQKFGFAPSELLVAVDQVNQLSNISLIGLMTIGPMTDNAAKIRGAFSDCHALFLQAKEISGDDFDTLSMGMSDDFELAIAEGSTMIRPGTAIFGARPTK
ncbi:MAG: YggS family pyridoxal phosphate-dependent enzyme [candidate division Zixibacteria bacterium]